MLSPKNISKTSDLFTYYDSSTDIKTKQLMFVQITGRKCITKEEKYGPLHEDLCDFTPKLVKHTT